MSRILFCVVTLICLPLANDAVVYGQSEIENELRLWNDSQGNEITARFIRYREGVVYLRTNNRTTVQVRPGQLSKKDQEYAIKLLKDQKKEKLANEFQRLTQSKQTGGFGSATPGGGRRGSPTRGGRGATNSGDANSSETLNDGPQAAGGGSATTPGGNKGLTRGGDRTPGSRPPGTTPAGDGPVVYGGDPNRTPSPYLRTPDSEAMELDSHPNGVPDPKKGGGIDPFAETELNRPDLSKGIPSSSNDYLGTDGKMDTSPGSSISSKVKNPHIDPFAEMKPVESASKFDDSKSKVLNNPFESDSSEDGGYVPPVIANKFDDSGSESKDSSEVAVSGGMSNQTLVLVAIGVVSLLILVMIALLVMVLVKSKHPKPRRSYF